jgi:hypothetical protein
MATLSQEPKQSELNLLHSGLTKLTISLHEIENFPPAHPLNTITYAIPLWWVWLYGALCPRYRQPHAGFPDWIQLYDPHTGFPDWIQLHDLIYHRPNGFTSISWRLFDDLRFNRIMHLGASPPSHPTRYLSRRVLTFPSLIWVRRTHFELLKTTVAAVAAGEIEKKILFYNATIENKSKTITVICDEN